MPRGTNDEKESARKSDVKNKGGPRVDGVDSFLRDDMMKEVERLVGHFAKV